MSVEYNEYLKNHKQNVRNAFAWIKENLPEVLSENYDYEYVIVFEHDASKTESDEYFAYDAYFYGGNRSYGVVETFKFAWLKHIHRNPHHWQHWVLHNDDQDEGMIVLDMPHVYIIEMICDWWSFSWNKGNLREIFGWYDERKDYMKLSENTRNTVEAILAAIKVKLDEVEREAFE